MIKLVAFDWNGTILSDTHAILKAENAVLKQYNLKTITVKKYREVFSVPIKNYWIKLGLNPRTFDRESENIKKIFFNHYEPVEKLCRTRSGTKEITFWLKTNKIKRLIFSNHSTQHIHRQLSRLKISKNFTTILGREPKDPSIMHFRSKETRLYHQIKQYKLKPHEVMTVGDTDEEIEIGKKFGYHTVALTGGEQSTARLKAAKPDFLIHNLKDLKKIIQKINKK